MNTKEEQIVDLLTASLSVYNENLSDQIISVWLASLMRFDIHEIKHAFNIYIQTSERGHFSPKPSDIVNIITGGNADVAKVAWSLVERSIRSIGGDMTVIFNDPLIHRVIYDIGGWANICSAESERDLDFIARDFETRYRGYMCRGIIPKYPNRLIGRSENSVREYGLKWQRYLSVVGDINECKKVFYGGIKPENIAELSYRQSAGNLARAFIENKNAQEAEIKAEEEAHKLGYYPDARRA